VALFISSFITFVAVSASSAPSCRVYLQAASSSNVTALSESEVRSLVVGSHEYQDKRNQEWSERNKCLCCHTTLPYILSRGLDSQSKSNFEKFRDLSIDKVQNPERELWYDEDNANRDSRPTEAVLNALTLVMYDISSLTALQPVTLKAMDRILENLDSDGHIHWLDYGLQPFESKQGELWGNSMALLAIEMAKKNSQYSPAVEKYNKLKTYVLSRSSSLKPHEMSVLLWAHSMKSDLLTAEQKSQFVQKIKNLQNADGSWNQKAVLGQGVERADTYATAISIIALVKAGQHDAKLDKAARWLASRQQTGSFLRINGDSTLWPSTSMNRNGVIVNDRFSSDFATSYASLALQMYRGSAP
jgi:hypothetical protein